MKAVRLIVYDFDGVLTDNRVWVSGDGTELVACNRSDGWWIKEIARMGIEQVILSTEANPVVAARGKKLGLEVFQGKDDKKAALLEIMRERELSPENVCFVGNEVNDLECLRLVGFPLAPRDSHPRVLELAELVIPADGGHGVVRHVMEWLTA